MDGHAALQIRECEGGLPIASVGGADQVKEGIVLCNGQQSSIAERPACRRKITAEHPYLAYERT
jgi:hypothetical protein